MENICHVSVLCRNIGRQTSEHTGDELAVVGQVSNGHNDYVTEVDGIPTTRGALGYTIQICRI